jgi:hypothetical protein
MRLFFDILLYLIFNLDLHNIRIGGVNVWLQQWEKKLIKLRKQKKINRKYQTEKKYQLEN